MKPVNATHPGREFSIFNFVEAPIGLEPMHRGFADLSLSHLGTAPFINPPFLRGKLLYSIDYRLFNSCVR